MRLIALTLACLPAASYATTANAEERTVVVRERAAASFLDGSYTFTLWKIHGYSIDLRIAGQTRRLTLGESFSPPEATCTIRFDEVATETRIARFTTDCS